MSNNWDVTMKDMRNSMNNNQQDNIIKVGIIGFGYMGHFHYEKMLLFPEKIRLVAIFDIDEKVRESAREAGLTTYCNIDGFLKEDIDLVIISTPNQWHGQYAIKAMELGKDVVLEKPAVMSVEEMEAIIKCEKENNRLLTVHHQRRHDTDFQVVSEVIKSGEIGNVTTIESRVMGERGVCFGWRGNPEYGGGMLYDWGVHLIDQSLQLFKDRKVKYVQARLLSVLTPAVDDYFELTVGFEGDLCSKILVTTFALEKLPRWFVFGDRGTLKIDDFTGVVGSSRKIKSEVNGYESVVGKKNLGPSRTMAPLATDFIENIELPTPQNEDLDYWTNLINSIENNIEPEVKADEILRVMKVVESAFISSRENKIIYTNI